MKFDTARPPDLLRRFVPTPYVFADRAGPNRYSVRSNDLEIALGVRRYLSKRRDENRPVIVSWQLIRDVLATDDISAISLFHVGELRTLMAGTATILFYDVQRSEFLGFVSSATTTKHLISELIPTLLKV